MRGEAPGRSPFTSISPQLRRLILLGFFGYLSFVGVGAFLQFRADVYLVYAAFCFRMLVLFLPIIFYKREYGILHPLVFRTLWAFVNVSLRQTPMYIFGLPFHNALPNYSSQQLNMLVAYHELLSGLGLLVLYISFHITPKLKVPVIEFKKPSFLFVKMCIIALFALSSFYIWAQALGGFERMLLIRGESAIDRHSEVSGRHLVVFLLSLQLGVMFWLSQRPKVIRNPVFWGFVAIASIISFGSTGSRSAVLYPLILLLLIHIWQIGKIPVVKSAALVILCVFMVGALGLFRVSTWSSRVLTEENFQGIDIVSSFTYGIEEFKNRATANHGGLPVLAKVPNEHPLLLGKSYLALATAPIPSAILPFSKPLSSGRLNGTIMYGSLAGIPTGTVSEAYWNFHIVGVIFIYFITGVIYKWMARFYTVNNRSPGMIVVYVVFLFYFALNGTDFFRYVQGTGMTIAIVLFCCGMPRLRGFR